jgi:hypothetical protein
MKDSWVALPKLRLTQTAQTREFIVNQQPCNSEIDPIQSHDSASGSGIYQDGDEVMSVADSESSCLRPRMDPPADHLCHSGPQQVAYGSGPEQAAMGEPSKRSPRYFTPRGTSKMRKRMSPPASASGLDGLLIGKENADDLKFASLYPREVVERCIQNLESANKEGELLDGEPLFPSDSDLDQLYRIQQMLGSIIPDQQDLLNAPPMSLL